MKLLQFAFVCAFTLFPGLVYAQSPILQSGSVVRGHAAKFIANGTAQDAGPWSGGGPNVGLTDLPIVNTGTPLCIYDAPITNSLGYHWMCLGSNYDGTKGIFNYGAAGGAATLPLEFCINGSCSVAPGTITGAPIAATNDGLKALSTATYSSVARAGFHVRGDTQWASYTSSGSACSLNSGLGDDGSQVQSADGKCWIASFPDARPSVKQFGAKGDVTNDDGPAFRAACAWALSTPGKSNTIYVPSGTYWLKSLDADGTTALHLNTGTADGQACSLEGPASAFDYASADLLDGPAIIVLGNGLNRPLMDHRKLGASSHVKNLTLHGNMANQTGWAGGPKSRLFLVQVSNSDATNVFPETGIIFDDVVLEAGYNGNLYVGDYRYMWATRLWSQYSGQTVDDNSIWITGYDSVFIVPQIGSNSGCGVFLESGSQYQISAGSIFSNGSCGLKFGGLQIGYATVWGTNIHNNPIGIRNVNFPPFSGSASIGAITCTGCTFDQASVADVYVDGASVNRQMKLISPSFVGSSTGGTPPVNNVYIDGGGIVEVIAPTLGTQASFTDEFTNQPARLFCTGAHCPTTAFVPTIGNGTPTFIGTPIAFAQKAGSMVHVTINLSTSNLGGATGPLAVGNFPWTARTQLFNYVSGCAISAIGGWTAPAGFDWLTASIAVDENQAILRRNSKSGQVSAGADASEFSSSTDISLSCNYIGSF